MMFKERALAALATLVFACLAWSSPAQNVTVAPFGSITVNGQTCTLGSTCKANSTKEAVCTTLATTAATKFCAPTGINIAAQSASTSAQELTPNNLTFTRISISLTAAPTSTNTHTFTVVGNGSTTNMPTCQITGAATTCVATGTGTITADQFWYVQDVTTGTPTTSSAYISTSIAVTN